MEHMGYKTKSKLRPEVWIYEDLAMHLCIYFVIMHIAHFYLVLRTYICSAEGHLIAILNFAQYAVQNCQTSFGQVLVTPYMKS